MGVWIETVVVLDFCVGSKSHPSWVCGLKLRVSNTEGNEFVVTPFVGVWIETSSDTLSDSQCSVTPFVGVWIETDV